MTTATPVQSRPCSEELVAAVPTPHITAEAGNPRRIRLAGLRHILHHYHNLLDTAVCQFGSHQVQCQCNPIQGTMECEVPSSHAPSCSDGDRLAVKAHIGDYETPSLVIGYKSSTSQHEVIVMNGDIQKPPDTLHLRILRKITRERSRLEQGEAYSLLHQCIAECLGTMFIVIFGVGSVCTAVLTDSNVHLWHIAVVWGFGVALAILSTASVSGAHLNPAVSLAFSLFRPKDFPFAKLLPYWLAQYTGGVLGGAMNLLIFGPLFRQFEIENGIIRGETNSLKTAKAFGEYFPSYDENMIEKDVISTPFAMMVEAWGTAVLMFMILALTDPRQKIMHNKELLPFYIGFTVAVLISLYAPLTQAGWNPARDFGPRLVAAMAGWGRVAIPGPKNSFWIYIIGPKIGAPLGALLYDLLINPGLLD